MNAPFRYTDSDRNKIRELLPLTPPTTQMFSSLPQRLPIIPSSTVQTQTPETALMMLELYANMFLVLEREFHLPLYTYRDLQAALNRAYSLASQTLLGADKRRDDVDKLTELAREAKAHFDARRRRRHQRTNSPRDWYVEKLLSVWESCGGTTAKEGRGGPMIHFIQCASSPVLHACDYKPLSDNAAREIVRKLQKERRPGD